MEKLRTWATETCDKKFMTRDRLVSLLASLKNDLDRVDIGPETSWDGSSLFGFWMRGNRSFEHSDCQIIWGRTYSSGSSDPLDKPKRLFSRLLDNLKNFIVRKASLEEINEMLGNFKCEYPKLDLGTFLERIKLRELLLEVLFAESTDERFTITLMCRVVRGSVFDATYFEELINT